MKRRSVIVIATLLLSASVALAWTHGVKFSATNALLANTGTAILVDASHPLLVQ